MTAEIRVEDGGGLASFKRAIGGDGPTQVLSAEPDLILLTVEPDLTAEPPTDPTSSSPTSKTSSPRSATRPGVTSSSSRRRPSIPRRSSPATGSSSFLDYSSEACRALTDEIVRVMEDYGSLDDRPR